MVYERYSSLLTENTHFGFNDVEAPKVSGYEGTTGCISALIEGATIAQNMFTDLINVDFLQEAANQGICGITESAVNEYIYEADGENTDAGSTETKTETKTDSKSDDKKGGIVSKIIGALKKFWSMITNAVSSATLKLQVYLTRDLAKFVKSHKLKSNEELSKMKIKVYKKINVGPINQHNMPQLSEFIGTDKSVTTDTIIAKVLGKEVKGLKAYEEEVMKACVTESKDVTISSVIKEVQDTLTAANRELIDLKNYKKTTDKTYKQDLATVKSNKKAVSKNGEYTVKDDKGNESKVKPEDKDKYVKDAATEIEFLKARHAVQMADIKMLIKLANIDISQAKAIYAKACGGKADASDNKDTKATDTPPETKGNETQEDQAANEAAFLEAVEYETEMELESIDWDELEEA